MYNPNYELSDKELLVKYGLKPYSNYEELSLQIVMLYCFKNGYDIRLEPDEEQQIKFFLELMPTLPDDVRDVFHINMSRPSRFYDSEIAWSVYDKLRNVLKEDLSRIYSHLLVALVQTSEPFITHGCYDYRHTLFLSEVLAYGMCESVEYDERKYPFLRALMPSLASGSYYKENLVDKDKLYRFIVMQLGCVLENPSEISEHAESHMEPQVLPFDDVEWDEYMNHLATDAIALLDPTEFNQTFFRFLDRYESVDQIWVPYSNEWQLTSEKKREIQSCIEERMLDEVITDGEKSILILTTRWGSSDVAFKKFVGGHIVDYPGISERVPYEEIVDYGYSLNPKIYVGADCDDDHEIVRLGDICELDIVGDLHDMYYDFAQNTSKSYHLLPDYHFCGSLNEVYINAEDINYYGIEPLDVIEGDRILYNGPHIHISEEGDYVLNTTASYYLCPKKKNWALRVKDDRVSLEYLAYVLFNSRAFQEFISTSPSPELFLKKKVAILKDRMSQEKVVAEFKNKNLPVVSSSNVYNVALLVPNCPDWIKTTMEECWYLKIQEFEHIVGDGGLLDMLSKGQESFDAVVVDAVVDSVRDRYKGLRNLMAKVQGRNIPVYLYTDVDDEFLQDDLSEQEYQYLKEGRCFKASDETTIDALVRNLRNELDGQDNKSAKRRGEYLREFEAAEWLEQKFPKLNLVSALTFSLSQPNKSFTTLRGVLNSLYKAVMIEISNGSGLDQVKSVGMLPQLLREGKYAHNNQVVFVVKGDIMPLPLAVSLCYASQIVNGAVHEEDVEKMDVKGYLSQIRSEHLAYSVIRIVMDFILWLHDVNFEFDGFCESADLNELHSVNCSGVLQQAGVNEYFCETEDEGRIHVFVKGKARLGAEIEITQVKHETKLRDKYKWITHTWNYKKEKE